MNKVKHLRIKLFAFILALGLIATHVALWEKTKKALPVLGIIPDVPTETQAKIYGLGDEQLYFRYLALKIQNSGDSFGRFTALRDYDYEALSRWFSLLDQLDDKSNFVPAVASYYYSNTQNAEDNIYIVDYLESTYERNPQKKWWWLYQAIYIAENKLEDRPRALRMAYKLMNEEGIKIPRWARQMPVFILERMGEKERALIMIKEFSEKYDDFTQGEVNFMNHFIKNRLGFLKEEVEKEAKYPGTSLFYSPKS